MAFIVTLLSTTFGKNNNHIWKVNAFKLRDYSFCFFRLYTIFVRVSLKRTHITFTVFTLWLTAKKDEVHTIFENSNMGGAAYCKGNTCFVWTLSLLFQGPSRKGNSKRAETRPGERLFPSKSALLFQGKGMFCQTELRYHWSRNQGVFPSLSLWSFKSCSNNAGSTGSISIFKPLFWEKIYPSLQDSLRCQGIKRATFHLGSALQNFQWHTWFHLQQGPRYFVVLPLQCKSTQNYFQRVLLKVPFQICCSRLNVRG